LHRAAVARIVAVPMCGIAGVLFFQNDAQPLDLTLLGHRGPDSSGEWRSPDRRLWLGHTRLAILDLSPTGAQPMLDPETGHVIVFNGEIYNHLELRPELEALGARFRGTSDTETLLAAYRCWGAPMLPRLKGMFAFGIYDAADHSVFLARDRFGIKPLYFHRSAHAFAFASELRGLVRREGLCPTRESIVAFLQWGCCPHSELLYPTVRELPVGSHLRITGDGRGEPVTYWPPARFEPTPATSDRASIVRHTRVLLEASVRQHILSDVPVACFLSGGVDSSVITALAARDLGRNLHTFSVGFDDPRYDESRFARLIAEKYQTDHTEIRLSAEEVIENVKEAVLHMDLPSVDAVNTYIVAKQVAQRGFKVALAGVGGDEIFGGYPHFRSVPRLKYLARLPRGLASLLLRLKKGRHFLSDIPDDADAGDFARWWRRSWNAALLREYGFDARTIPTEPCPELLDDFARISWAELSHYMRDMLLRDSDQMSMAVSLEVRVPFLDHELVEFLLSLPAAEKYRPEQVKSLLIESTRDLLPREIYARRKMGFELPMPAWIRGPLRQFTLDGFSYVVAHGVLDAKQTQELFRRFLGGGLHWQKLWPLVVLGWYLERKNAPVTDPAPGRS
jgi:asparagine synthase (glutamine-hydrolysing)